MPTMTMVPSGPWARLLKYGLRSNPLPLVDIVQSMGDATPGMDDASGTDAMGEGTGELTEPTDGAVVGDAARTGPAARPMTATLSPRTTRDAARMCMLDLARGAVPDLG